MSITILGIDVGPERSAYCELTDARTIGRHAWVENSELLDFLVCDSTGHVILESPQAQDRPLGKLLRDTIFWAGRFYECASACGRKVIEAEERDVAFWLTGNRSAGNPAVLQSLKDQFGDRAEIPCAACSMTGQMAGKRPGTFKQCERCKGEKFVVVAGPLKGMNEHERSALAAAYWYWQRTRERKATA